MMDEAYVKCLQRLYMVRATLLGRKTMLVNIATPTDHALTELNMVSEVASLCELATKLLEGDPGVPDEFQVELPWD